MDDCYVEAYVRKLNKEVTVNGDENDLYWSETTCDFFDITQYAGEGNIGHIVKHIELLKAKLLIE